MLNAFKKEYVSDFEKIQYFLVADTYVFMTDKVEIKEVYLFSLFQGNDNMLNCVFLELKD